MENLDLKKRQPLWMVYTAACALIFIAFLNQASRFYEAGNPERALAISPLNTDARVNLAAHQLSFPAPAEGVEALRAQIIETIRLAPADPRGYSLLGELEYRQGYNAKAYRLFEHAQGLSKTEILSLRRLFERAYTVRDMAAAARYADLILRRRPGEFGGLAPYFPAVVADPEGYKEIMAAFEAHAPWPSGLIQYFNSQPQLLPLSARLVLSLRAASNPVARERLPSVISAFVAARRYQEAYQLFLSTLTAQEQEDAGYIFNGHFRFPSGERPFDWQIHDEPGTEIRVRLPDSKGGDGKAVIRFMDKPAKTLSFSQVLKLPTGRFVLKLDISGEGLKLPKGLFWSLRCAETGKELLRLPVPEGSYDLRKLEGQFKVNDRQCPLQALALANAVIADSWSYRYAGALTLHSVNIELTGE